MRWKTPRAIDVIVLVTVAFFINIVLILLMIFARAKSEFSVYLPLGFFWLVLAYCTVFSIVSIISKIVKKEKWDPPRWYWLFLPVVVWFVFNIIGLFLVGQCGTMQNCLRYPLFWTNFILPKAILLVFVLYSLICLGVWFFRKVRKKS